MTSFENKEGEQVLNRVIQVIQDNAKMLSEVDGAIGDGDHGINMNKGFTMCAQRLAQRHCGLTEGLETLGTILIAEIGGSMGPLYGTFFLEMAKASTGHLRIDKEVFCEMLERALSGVEFGGKCKSR